MSTLDRVTLERLQPDEEDGPEELRQFWEALFGFGGSIPSAFFPCASCSSIWKGEEGSIYPITRQFWDEDYKQGGPSYEGCSGRRGLLDIVR